jgi:hypothetical protein
MEISGEGSVDSSSCIEFVSIPVLTCVQSRSYAVGYHTPLCPSPLEALKIDSEDSDSCAVMNQRSGRRADEPTQENCTGSAQLQRRSANPGCLESWMSVSPCMEALPVNGSSDSACLGMTPPCPISFFLLKSLAVFSAVSRSIFAFDRTNVGLVMPDDWWFMESCPMMPMKSKFSGFKMVDS